MTQHDRELDLHTVYVKDGGSSIFSLRMEKSVDKLKFKMWTS